MNSDCYHESSVRSAFRVLHADQPVVPFADFLALYSSSGTSCMRFSGFQDAFVKLKYGLTVAGSLFTELEITAITSFSQILVLLRAIQ